MTTSMSTVSSEQRTKIFTEFENLLNKYFIVPTCDDNNSDNIDELFLNAQLLFATITEVHDLVKKKRIELIEYHTNLHKIRMSLGCKHSEIKNTQEGIDTSGTMKMNKDGTGVSSANKDGTGVSSANKDGIGVSSANKDGIGVNNANNNSKQTIKSTQFIEKDTTNTINKIPEQLIAKNDDQSSTETKKSRKRTSGTADNKKNDHNDNNKETNEVDNAVTLTNCDATVFSTKTPKKNVKINKTEKTDVVGEIAEHHELLDVPTKKISKKSEKMNEEINDVPTKKISKKSEKMNEEINDAPTKKISKKSEKMNEEINDSPQKETIDGDATVSKENCALASNIDGDAKVSKENVKKQKKMNKK